MATKDISLLGKPNIVISNIPKDQYNNLSLNQNYHYSNASSVQSKSIINDTNKGLQFNDSQIKQDKFSLNSGNNSNTNLSSRFLHCTSKEKDELDKSKNNSNNSTLSLHITAYENSIEAASGTFNDAQPSRSNTDKKFGLVKTKDKQLVTDPSTNIQHVFEIPRQQSDKAMDPEIMQYKASQKLFNPNSAISRTETSQFYNSLTAKQKQFFTKYQNERDVMEKELRHTQKLLHEEKKANENQLTSAEMVQSRDSTKEKLQNDLLSNGLNINAKIPLGTKLTNRIFYDLLKLIDQRHQRREKVLEFFGLENHVQDLTILPPKYLDKFEQQFVKSRTKAVKDRKLIDFEKEMIIFPNDKLPLERETTLGNCSNTVTERSPDDDGETDAVDYSDIPALEAMEVDIVEPLAKKGRLETYPINFSSAVDAACQTDLQLKHISEFERIKRKFKNLQDMINYHKKKAEHLKDSNAEYENLVSDLNKECVEMKEILDELQLLRNEKSKLNRDVQDRDLIIAELREEKSENEGVVQLKDVSGKFTVEAQGSFGQLITECSIAHDKVPKTIQIIADLLKVKVNSLPSRWTVDRSLHMVHGLNSEHIAKVLSECSNKAILNDETKKFTKQIDAFAAAGKNDKTHENFIIFIGAGQVPDKSALRTFTEIEHMLGEIASICKIDKEVFWNDFVISTRSTVSDEASTCKLFAKLFFKYRSSVIENLTHLDEATKARLERVHTFFCRIHMISNTTPHVLTVFLEHEKEITENNDLQTSTAEWAVKTFAKKFGKRSSAKHGSACDWETYALKKNLKFYKIDSFHGHRFAIFYSIALEIIYNRIDLLEFLDIHGGNDEILIQLKAALNNETTVLHLHLLALFDILIISPFWRFSEKCESVLQTRNVAIPLINFLKTIIDEPMALFLGESPFDAFPASFALTKKGKEFETALKQMPAPVGASEIIPVIASNLLNYFEKKLEPFVTGDYAFPDMAMEKETAGVPCTNRAIESYFGVIDHLIDFSPNMTVYNVIIKATALKNKLYKHVYSLPEKERAELYEKAYKAMKTSAQLASQKKKLIQRELFEKMERKAKEQAEEKSKIQRKKHKLAAEIEVCGFWRTIDAMDEALEGKSPKDVKAWVKSNIQYRKMIWTPSFEPKWLMQISYKGHTFTSNELMANLKQLINADPCRAITEEDNDEE